MSLSGAQLNVDWQDRKINLIDCPGDAGFQADTLAALRVVEGALVVVSAVMGVEVNTTRVWKRADEYELSRVVFVNMLDRERADFFRVLEAVRAQLSDRCVAIQLPIGAEHEVTGIVDLLHMCAYIDPAGGKEGGPQPIPDRAGGPGAGVPREAARRGRRDERGPDGALPRGRGAAGRGRRARAEGRGDARRALPGRLRRRDEEPRHDRAPRPARRGRAVAGEEGNDDRVRRREAGGVRLQDDRRPVRRTDQLLSRPRRPDHGRHDARRSAHAREGAARPDPAPERQGERAGRVALRRRPRRRREAEGRRDRRRARRSRGAGRAAAHRLPRAGDELRDHAEGEGRRGEDGGRAAPSLGGGSDDLASPRSADGRAADLRADADAGRGRGRPASQAASTSTSSCIRRASRTRRRSARKRARGIATRSRPAVAASSATARS